MARGGASSRTRALLGAVAFGGGGRKKQAQFTRGQESQAELSILVVLVSSFLFLIVVPFLPFFWGGGFPYDNTGIFARRLLRGDVCGELREQSTRELSPRRKHPADVIFGAFCKGVHFGKLMGFPY